MTCGLALPKASVGEPQDLSNSRMQGFRTGLRITHDVRHPWNQGPADMRTSNPTGKRSTQIGTERDRAGRQAGQDNAASNALASCRSAVSKPSVNQP